MMEKLKEISLNTVIPLGLMITIGAGIWFAAKLSFNVEGNRSAIELLNSRVDQAPTRLEYELLKSDISEIKMDLKALIKNLSAYDITLAP